MERGCHVSRVNAGHQLMRSSLKLHLYYHLLRQVEHLSKALGYTLREASGWPIEHLTAHEAGDEVHDEQSGPAALI